MSAKRSTGLFSWALAQVVRFVLLLLQVVVGPFVAIAQRRFHWRAFAVGVATLVIGLTCLVTALAANTPDTGSDAPEALWAGALVVFFLAGFCVGWVGRRVGFWESYLASLATLAFVWVHLQWGWHHVLRLGPGDRESYLELLAALPPGVTLLGDQWQRLTGLGAAIGFALAVFGGSFAYLFLGEGRFEASFSVPRFVGVRHLMATRRGLVSVTALVAVVGIAVGVSSLVTVTAVMSGYQGDIESKILSTNAHLVIQKYGTDFTEYEEVARKAKSVPGVIATSPFTFGDVLLSAGTRGIGVLNKGIDPASAGDVTHVLTNLCERVDEHQACVPYAAPTAAHLAEVLRQRDGVPGLLVGLELYKRAKLPLGSIVSVTTPVGLAGARNAPKRMEFRLTGVFRSGMHEFDSRLVYMEMGASQQMMGIGRSITGLELKLADPSRVKETTSRVLRAIGRYPYRTIDWRELNSPIFRAVAGQKIMFYLVLVFIVIVAAFNIASTLFMAVIEKAHEIGVLKSMGTRDTTVMKIFVLEGWIVGGAGTLLGILLGLGVSLLLSKLEIRIAADVYMVPRLTVSIQPLEILMTGVAAFVISHLATLYPAMKAARQRPVDAMRYE